MARASWLWVLCDRVGTPLAELSTAAGKLVAYKRNSFAEANCSISHADDAADLLFQALAAGTPQLKCYRTAAGATSGILRFRGHLAPFTEEAEDDSVIRLVFRSPFARLLGSGQDRGRFTGASDVFIGMDAGQIAKQLVDATNIDGATGLATDGTIDVTKPRRQFYHFANIGESIINLTRLLDGFDFEEIYTEGTSLATFRVYASMGSDRPSARFEYGPETLSNVRSVVRTTQPPINRARVLGANNLVAVMSDLASITRHGLWMSQASLADAEAQSIIDDQAQGMIRPNPVKTVNFVPDFALPACPRPWDDFWVGDTVRFYARRDALTEDVAVRVNELRVVIDESGYEAVAIPDPAVRDEDAKLESRMGVEVTG